MDAIWLEDVAFARHFMAILVLATPVKELSEMVENSASYLPNSWWID